MEVLTHAGTRPEADRIWPDTLYRPPAGRERDPVLRTRDGDALVLHRRRWHGRPAPEELRLLARAPGPALDIGCGPGRHVLALLHRGQPALGIDTSHAAVAAARRRGAPVVRASVFADVPGAGRWGSALLLDGNIGIGGDPVALLRRVATLIAPQARALVELDDPAITGGHVEVRIEEGRWRGPWFPWARVAASELAGLAGASGFEIDQQWQSRGRWFADLRRA